jgi:cytoskeletal protein RodZ
MKECLGSFDVAAALRESRGIAIEDIAQTTKINPNYLRAIERGEFDILPGGVYNTSYIRQYARAIEFDEQELLEAYGRTQPAETLPPKPHQSSLRRRLSELSRGALCQHWKTSR